jgi:hypothetical protein
MPVPRDVDATRNFLSGIGSMLVGTDRESIGTHVYEINTSSHRISALLQAEDGYQLRFASRFLVIGASVLIKKSAGNKKAGEIFSRRLSSKTRGFVRRA